MKGTDTWRKEITHSQDLGVKSEENITPEQIYWECVG